EALRRVGGEVGGVEHNRSLTVAARVRFQSRDRQGAVGGEFLHQVQALCRGHCCCGVIVHQGGQTLHGRRAARVCGGHEVNRQEVLIGGDHAAGEGKSSLTVAARLGAKL